MKLSEMNGRQQMVARIAWERCGWVVGGLENVLQDNLPDDEDYIRAKNSLADHDYLVQEIYYEVMSITDKGIMKHLRFVGKDFIMERIEKRLAKWGY